MEGGGRMLEEVVVDMAVKEELSERRRGDVLLLSATEVAYEKVERAPGSVEITSSVIEYGGGGSAVEYNIHIVTHNKCGVHLVRY